MNEKFALKNIQLSFYSESSATEFISPVVYTCLSLVP